MPAASNAPFRLARLPFLQWDAAAQLIHAALSEWYEQHLNQPGRFGTAWEPFRVFPEIYEALDPGCAVIAEDRESGLLRGICFFHPRPTHVSVGIVAVHPGSGGRGVARAMLEEVFRHADAAGLPVRLVSSLMNLDSFSLYTRMGFVPGSVYQDLQFPPGVLPLPADFEGILRPATCEDIPAMVALEQTLIGLDRGQDFRFMVENDSGCWHTLLLTAPDGTLGGFLASIHHGETRMLGPGMMRDEAGALALISAQLQHHAPANPVVLVPAEASRLVQTLYQAGARNVELHVAQVRGGGRVTSGIVIPTFLPESG